jgi:hypothetical protein
MAAAEAAFMPDRRGPLTVKQIADICCGLVRFLERAGELPDRSMADWKVAIENLRITLGAGK